MSLWKIFGASSGSHRSLHIRVLKKGHAMRVVFFYPGEEGTYIDHADVTIYENGIVHLKSALEETTTHLQNCEILWSFKTDAEDRNAPGKIRLLKTRTSEAEDSSKNPPPPTV
ncbi:MAG: hypothetical protein RJB38_623 [Pseudomonadota bacterium]|jgi:hypothetical protein